MKTENANGRFIESEVQEGNKGRLTLFYFNSGSQ